jgi:hypothetical protein
VGRGLELEGLELESARGSLVGRGLVVQQVECSMAGRRAVVERVLELGSDC